MHLLGIRLLTDGWDEVAIQMQLCDLRWVSACMPTPLGESTIDVEGQVAQALQPAGIIAHVQGRKRRGAFTYRL
jgi:hypothetical protein